MKISFPLKIGMVTSQEGDQRVQKSSYLYFDQTMESTTASEGSIIRSRKILGSYFFAKKCLVTVIQYVWYYQHKYNQIVFYKWDFSPFRLLEGLNTYIGVKITGMTNINWVPSQWPCPHTVYIVQTVLVFSFLASNPHHLQRRNWWTTIRNITQYSTHGTNNLDCDDQSWKFEKNRGFSNICGFYTQVFFFLPFYFLL